MLGYLDSYQTCSFPYQGWNLLAMGRLSECCEVSRKPDTFFEFQPRQFFPKMDLSSFTFGKTHEHTDIHDVSNTHLRLKVVHQGHKTIKIIYCWNYCKKEFFNITTLQKLKRKLKWSGQYLNLFFCKKVNVGGRDLLPDKRLGAITDIGVHIKYSMEVSYSQRL